MQRLLIVLSLVTLGAPPAPARGESRVSLGYVASFVDNDIDKIPWRHLTHVSHAYLRTDEQGKLITNERIPSRALTAAARERGVLALLSLGGGRTTGGLERVTRDRASIARYVRAVTAAVAANGYDGVDLVWEFPRSRATRAGFVDLGTALRNGLDQQARADGRGGPYLLVAAVSPEPAFGKWIDIGAVIKRLDWLHVTTYDMAGPWKQVAGHHAPLFASPSDPQRAWRSVAQAMAYWREDRGVPREKLVVGIPLYARVYPVTEAYAELDPKRRKQHGTLTFAQVRELIGRGWPAEWDDTCKAPWLSPPDGKRMKIAYDDRNSVDQKAKWAREQGYRGLSFWAVHQDRMSDGTHWLLRAADKAWPIGE